MFVCKLCVDDHIDHVIKDIDTLVKEVTEIILHNIELLHAALNKQADILKHWIFEKERFLASKKTAQEIVCNTFDQTRAILDQTEKTLLDRIESKSSEVWYLLLWLLPTGNDKMFFFWGGVRGLSI